MPLVRIDLNKDAPSERVRVVSQAVYGAMTDIANVPVNDKFQIVTRHSADEMIYPDEGYQDVKYSPDLIFIQVTWVGGRSTDVKKQFIAASPTKFTRGRASARKTSGSAWWIQGGRTGRSATATCNTRRNRAKAALKGRPNRPAPKDRVARTGRRPAAPSARRILTREQSHSSNINIVLPR